MSLTMGVSRVRRRCRRTSSKDPTGDVLIGMGTAGMVLYHVLKLQPPCFPPPEPTEKPSYALIYGGTDMAIRSTDALHVS